MLPASKAAAGYNVHIHAVGDAAISQALDVQTALGEISGTKTICRVQVMPEDGVRRFAEQKNIFYQTTPIWLGADKFTADVLGPERCLRRVPLATLLKNGVTLTFGSDFPVSGGEAGVEPVQQHVSAVNRATDERVAPPKTEGISVADCIDAYTINGARQVAAEDRIGSITVGKSADFIVCSEDPLTIDPKNLMDVAVEETYLRGARVYEKR